MPDEDYLADLIKKVKQAKREEGKEKEEKAPRKEGEGKKAESVREGVSLGKELEKTLKGLEKEGREKEEAAQEKGVAVEEGTEEVPPEEEAAAEGKEEAPPEKSAVEKEIEKAKEKKLVASKGEVKIYQLPGKPLLYYFVPVARPTKQEKTIINTVKEAATRLITISPYRIRDSEQRRAVYRQRILEILRNSPELHIPERRFNFYAESVVREMVGYGIIDPLVQDDALEEIMVIGAKKPVYLFHREYEMMTSNIEFYSDKEIIDLVNKIGRHVGRRVDISSPLLDARLPDGSRVNATIPPASVEGPTLTIRKFRADPYSIVDLIKLNTLSTELAAFLWMSVDGLGAKPANILIAGGTSSGKTTTLNCLAAFIPDTERIITIEDTAELRLPLKHWIRLEARPPGLEGKGELTLDVLTKNSLRMRPDRIIVGEVRHDEAFTLFTALNTGHEGALTGDALVQFSDGNIVEIGDFAEKMFEGKTGVKEGSFEFVELKGDIKVPSLNKETLKIENQKINHVWRKKTREKLCKIRLHSGKELRLTKDHPIYRINRGLQEINAMEARVGDFIATPCELELKAEEELTRPYLTGLIYGDGHLGQEIIQFVNKDPSLIKEFKQEMQSATKNKISQFDYDGFSRVQIFDKVLIRNINREYDMPIGNKTKTFKITEKTLLANDKEIAPLVGGLFDCETHVNLKSNCLQFSTANKDLERKLPLILMRFGIASSTYAQEKDEKGNVGPYYRISIYGKDNLEKYAEKIGFRHKGKAEKLRLLIKKSKNSLDLFPNLSGLIRNARLDAGLTQTELGALLGLTTPSTPGSYERGVRKPSRAQLKKLCDVLQNRVSKQLKMLADSGMRLEEVVSAEEEMFEGYVYDLTVEDNHNYVANGVIVSNCMGTVHANSPQETIVRVTSPPMNVPEVMLSGLDLILVEHKIHDKRKGTIRRIGEVAEVSGVLLKHAQTQTIFHRDPAKDTIERTGAPIKFLSILKDFTGLAKSEIDAEWKRREEFLQQLVKRGIHDIGDVKRASQQFLLERG